MIRLQIQLFRFVFGAVALLAGSHAHAEASCRFKAEASRYLTESGINSGGIENFSESVRSKGADPGDVICCLPEAYQDNYILVTNSHSAQSGTPDAPRVIFYDPANGKVGDAEPLQHAFSFNSGKRIEKIDFNQPDGKNSPNSFSDIAFDGEKSHHSRNGNTGNGCKACHANGVPLFDRFPHWPGVLGGTLSLSKVDDGRELKHLRAFQQTLLNDPKKANNYRCLKDIHKKLVCLENTLLDAEKRMRETRGPSAKDMPEAQQRRAQYCEKLAEAAADQGHQSCEGIKTLRFQLTEFGNRIAREGEDQMIRCLTEEPDPEFAAVLGAAACPGVDPSEFFPPGKGPAPREFLPIPKAGDEATCENAPLLARDFQGADLGRRAAYNNVKNLLERSGKSKCLKVLARSRDRAHSDAFRSGPLTNLTQSMAKIAGSSPNKIPELDRFYKALSRSRGAQPGLKPWQAASDDECVDLARTSRNLLRKKHGMPEEDDVEAGRHEDGIRNQLYQFQIKAESFIPKNNAQPTRSGGPEKAAEAKR